MRHDCWTHEKPLAFISFANFLVSPSSRGDNHQNMTSHSIWSLNKWQYGIEYRQTHEKRKAACRAIFIISTNKITILRVLRTKECPEGRYAKQQTTDSWVRIANIKSCGQRSARGLVMNILIQIPKQTSIDDVDWSDFINPYQSHCLLKNFFVDNELHNDNETSGHFSFEKWHCRSNVYESKEKPLPHTPFYAHQGVEKLLFRKQGAFACYMKRISPLIANRKVF